MDIKDFRERFSSITTFNIMQLMDSPFFLKSNQSCLRFLVYTGKSNRAILGVLGLSNFNEIPMCELLSMY